MGSAILIAIISLILICIKQQRQDNIGQLTSILVKKSSQSKKIRPNPKKPTQFNLNSKKNNEIPILYLSKELPNKPLCSHLKVEVNNSIINEKIKI